MTFDPKFDRYGFSPIPSRPVYDFPDGKRLAVYFALNIEAFEFGRNPGPDFTSLPSAPFHRGYAYRDYGNRVGLWRMMELMDRLGMRGTVCLNSEIIREYPRIMDEAIRRNWAFIGHGINNAPANFLSGIDEKKERAIIGGVLSAMEKRIGRKTRGWLSPFLTHTNNTPRILAELGVEYLCDYTADDHPFPLNVPRGSLISVPYTVELNDIPAFQNVGVSSAAFGDAIVDQFDVLYDEGADNARCMPICLHTFWVGQPNKFKHLKRAFAHIASHDHVWFATGDDVNDWYRKNYLQAPRT